MARKTHPVETILTAQQMVQLAELAEQTGKSISELIWAEVEQTHFRLRRPKQREALARLLALGAPVADWPQMEAEIEREVLE